MTTRQRRRETVGGQEAEPEAEEAFRLAEPRRRCKLKVVVREVGPEARNGGITERVGAKAQAAQRTSVGTNPLDSMVLARTPRRQCFHPGVQQAAARHTRAQGRARPTPEPPSSASSQAGAPDRRRAGSRGARRTTRQPHRWHRRPRASRRQPELHGRSRAARQRAALLRGRCREAHARARAGSRTAGISRGAPRATERGSASRSSKCGAMEK